MELELDVACRSKPMDDGADDKGLEVDGNELKEINDVLIEVQDGMVKMNKIMEEGFQRISSMFGGYETRLKAVESFVNSQGWNDRGDFDFDKQYRPRSSFWTHSDCSGGGQKQKEAKRVENDPLEKDPKTELEKEPKSGVEKETKAEAIEKELEAEEAEKDPESGVDKEAEAEKGEESEVEKEPEAEKHNEVVGEKRIKKPSAAMRTPYRAPNPAKRSKKN
ncbi:unnamed protein product [Arabis nemorensis]|uniref:DUF287 domain-containing protein n=1 Tax=Arabis nemorensis TaxID=586526 RepID=A0A565AS13_9BRAS|nr:unnamed protein product [Arabis nemorensis]